MNPLVTRCARSQAPAQRPYAPLGLHSRLFRDFNEALFDAVCRALSALDMPSSCIARIMQPLPTPACSINPRVSAVHVIFVYSVSGIHSSSIRVRHSCCLSGEFGHQRLCRNEMAYGREQGKWTSAGRIPVWRARFLVLSRLQC